MPLLQFSLCYELVMVPLPYSVSFLAVKPSYVCTEIVYASQRTFSWGAKGLAAENGYVLH